MSEIVSDKRLSLRCVVQKDEIDGGYIAECLDIPGCMSHGQTEEEANANLADALSACITVLISDSLKLSEPKRIKPTSGMERQENFLVTPLAELSC